MANGASIADVRRLYGLYKRRYYSEYALPAADEVVLSWFTHPHLLGRSTRMPDPDHDEPEASIELHEVLRRLPRLLSLILMHEMSHIAFPRLNHGRGWRKEANRLGALGAMEEFF